MNCPEFGSAALCPSRFEIRGHAFGLNLPFRCTFLTVMSLRALCSPPSLLGQAADPPQELTPQERQTLEAPPSERFRAGYQAYPQGDLVKAVARTRVSLQILGSNRAPASCVRHAADFVDFGENSQGMGHDGPAFAPIL
jgi:hypothetical protein